jgi:hypothetical protein
MRTVNGSGTSLEGDRWVPVTDGDDGDPVMWLEVETPNGHHMNGSYGGPPMMWGMRVEMNTLHDDVGPDRIIVRVSQRRRSRPNSDPVRQST